MAYIIICSDHTIRHDDTHLLLYYLKILATADDNAVVLPNDITLGVVQREICDNPMNYEMILHYRLLPLERHHCS